MKLKLAQLLLWKIAFRVQSKFFAYQNLCYFAGTAWWFLKSRLVSIESQRKKNCIAGGPEGIEVRRSVSTVTRKMQNSTVGLMTQSSFRRKFLFSRILRPSMFYKELVVFTENSSLSWEINCWWQLITGMIRKIMSLVNSMLVKFTNVKLILFSKSFDIGIDSARYVRHH